MLAPFSNSKSHDQPPAQVESAGRKWRGAFRAPGRGVFSNLPISLPAFRQSLCLYIFFFKHKNPCPGGNRPGGLVRLAPRRDRNVSVSFFLSAKTVCPPLLSRDLQLSRQDFEFFRLLKFPAVPARIFHQAYRLFPFPEAEILMAWNQYD